GRAERTGSVRRGSRTLVWLLGAWLATIPASAFATEAIGSDGEAEAPSDGGGEPADGTGEPEVAARSERAEAGEAAITAPPVPLATRFAEPLEGGQRVRLRYQLERTKSQGLLIGDRDVNPGRVRDALFLDYEETPRALDVTVHTVELAWAPHPRTTLIAQVPFLLKDLE